jgi:hypothetical protein
MDLFLESWFSIWNTQNRGTKEANCIKVYYYLGFHGVSGLEYL